MCLATPGKIIDIVNENEVLCDFGGTTRQISITLLGNPVEIGDYLLVHTGYAINKLEEREALETLELWKEIMEMSQEPTES